MMKSHLQEGMDNLKELFMGMMLSVREQVFDAKHSLEFGDKDLAEIVIQREKAINRKELVVDKECEKILALYGPVAIDLRLVLSIIEMNTHLERLGDLAEMIAEGVITLPSNQLKTYVKKLALISMYDEIVASLDLTIECFENDDIHQTPKVLIKTKHVKSRLEETKSEFAKIIKAHPEKADFLLVLFSISRAIMRMVDMIDNVVEEIVFYVEAKVIKHKKKKHKKLVKHIKSKDEEASEVDDVGNPDDLLDDIL